MGNKPGPLSETGPTILEHYMRAAREDMDGPALLKLLKKLEDEIARRGRLA
ncbi:hypothetical protein ABH991_004633 [Bradyrhizobium ottawaense]|jgi:hypothetical protein|uniref:Anti-sigma factor NepR domain-containing protein n=1 Tax=Bradyrhizobium ottawaense TaxID=931866 RepID=A0ABV4G0J4_9BRAD|nr:hypothetical protein BwSF12_12400 [Bradyrhizobium ottawaense]GMO26439.1 hypothetical protein TM233_36840 [Bradyrhizobium sp. TM233]GMO75470.1 hypothetical protein BwSG20_47180 [Bradyrhizobium ottawaense]GMP10284.1 hypothetical protein BwSH20_62350 [Bradyrhizobium ottawaense]GMP13300.1 hypothetical protein TM239_68840 [Bradyrhizobium sp. TM239]